MLRHEGASWLWQITPAPEYISDPASRNPKVILGKPGDYDVTLAVTQEGKLFSRTINKMVIASSCPSVYDCNNPGEVEKERWQLVYVDSEETNAIDGKATNAFDGDPATVWHTNYSNTYPDHPHEIQIDLGESYLVSKFLYQPRIQSQWGRIKNFELYVSENKTNFGTPVYSDEFADNTYPQEFAVQPVEGRYVKLKTSSSYQNHPSAVLGEIGLVGCIQSPTSITNYDIGALEAYPIPAKEELTIRLPQIEGKNKWTYKIINASSIVIKSDQFIQSSPTHTFSLKDCLPGLHLLLIETDNGAAFKVNL